jgi:hypothetical protein
MKDWTMLFNRTAHRSALGVPFGASALVRTLALFVPATLVAGATALPVDDAALLRKLNEPAARVSEAGKSATKLFTAYLDMTKPPEAIGEDFNQTTIYPGMDGFDAWANWAKDNEFIGKTLVEIENAQILGVPYGTKGVDPKFVERGLVIEVGVDGDLSEVRFPYLTALETIATYSAAEMYRRCEAGEFEEGFKVGLATLRVLRQACDAQMFREKLSAMTLLSDAFSVHRDVLFTYSEKMPLALLKQLSLKDYPFLKAGDTERLKRIELPEGDLLVAEELLRSVFGDDGQITDERFREVFARMQAEDAPLTGFGASKRWGKIAEKHGSLEASSTKLHAIYDDWWRRWRLPEYAKMMELPTELSVTNPVRYAAVMLAVDDIDSIFAARRRLVAEFSGTVCAAGIVSYRKEFGVWPDDIKKAYTQFFPKRFNFDPYDREYGQFRFESVTRERGVETDDGRVSVTGCILYARNDDHEFNGASRHSAGGGSDDFVLWPPLRAVARGQGE